MRHSRISSPVCFMRLILLAFIMIALSPIARTLQASTAIDIVSEEHTIRGYCSAYPDPVEYTISSNQPLSQSCSYLYDTVSSQAGLMEVSAWTLGGPDGYWADAYSRYVFAPRTSSVQLLLQARYGWTAVSDGLEFAYTLTDLGEPQLVSSYTSNICWDPGDAFSGPAYWNLDETLILDTTHEYELTLYAYADSWDGQSMKLTAELVPAPATCLLLTAGAVILRRRRALGH